MLWTPAPGPDTWADQLFQVDEGFMLLPVDPGETLTAGTTYLLLLTVPTAAATSYAFVAADGATGATAATLARTVVPTAAGTASYFAAVFAAPSKAAAGGASSVRLGFQPTGGGDAYATQSTYDLA